MVCQLFQILIKVKGGECRKAGDFLLTSADADKPEEEAPLRERQNITFPSVSFKGNAYLHRLKC